MILEAEVAREKMLKTLCASRIVLTGPFKGLKYPALQSAGSVIIPKLLGSYEMELHHLLDEIEWGSYSTIVDIGAAEGYYAVGMALKAPNARVVAFECDSTAQQLLRNMAEINDVAERIHVEGSCDATSLANTSISGRGLIVSDCEGAENEILAGPFLENAGSFDMLVETHDFIAAGLTDRLIQRFAHTHATSVFCSVQRTAREFPVPSSAADFEKIYALSEARPGPQKWLWLESRTQGVTGRAAFPKALATAWCVRNLH